MVWRGEPFTSVSGEDRAANVRNRSGFTYKVEGSTPSVGVNKGGTMAFQQGGGRFGGQPREMYKATCADCNKECEVPFKPSGDRQVYCKECFSKRKGSDR